MQKPAANKITAMITRLGSTVFEPLEDRVVVGSGGDGVVVGGGVGVFN